MMERILDHLRTHLDAAPDDDKTLLKGTVDVLQHIQQHPHGPHPVSWEVLHRNFQRLQDHGLWERSAENDELLDALCVLLTSSSDQKPALGEKFSIVIPPQSVSSQFISNQDPLLLPVELIDILNDAYFLHVLATDPAQILPPGKSLVSIMSRTRTLADGNTKPTLHSKVEDIVHKAFWDEAVTTLSNPEPSAQLSRMKLLYKDLHVALSPLLPPEYPVLVTLSSPLSPTSSPLDSTVMHLREVLASLRQRCAPVRDSEIIALERPLDDPPPRSTPVALAKLVVETVRSILRLSELMKDDLSQFILGSMTEQQLRSVVVKQAKTTEREIVSDIWHRDGITQGWASWLDKLEPPAHLSSISAEPRFLWIVRIVQALGLSSPVACRTPSRTVQISPTAPSGNDSNETAKPCTTNANTLPPVFFLSTLTLLKIQNYLQALVIAASLGVLARIPATPRTSLDSSDPESFMSRIWTLLRAEIAGEPDADDTKLVNLADEVIRARTQATAAPSTPTSTCSLLSKEDEGMLRAAVERTLRYEDPVYKLLQRRLLTELVNVLVKRRQGEAARDGGAGPGTLRTGRDGKRARLVVDAGDMEEMWRPSRVVGDVKGFEDSVLRRAVVDVFERVDGCLWWVEKVWSCLDL